MSPHAASARRENAQSAHIAAASATDNPQIIIPLAVQITPLAQ